MGTGRWAGIQCFGWDPAFGEGRAWFGRDVLVLVASGGAAGAGSAAGAGAAASAGPSPPPPKAKKWWVAPPVDMRKDPLFWEARR